MQKGLIMVYTGNGKGKTTAALGLALRALGHGQQVFMLQFMKMGSDYGEVIMAKQLPGFTLVQKGLTGFIRKGEARPEDIIQAQQGLDLARNVIIEGKHDLVILDEINMAIDFGLIAEEEVLAIIELKPAAMSLVLTGRNAATRVMERADLVSEVREIKHHYQQGVPAQPGIEF